MPGRSGLATGSQLGSCLCLGPKHAQNPVHTGQPLQLNITLVAEAEYLHAVDQVTQQRRARISFPLACAAMRAARIKFLPEEVGPFAEHLAGVQPDPHAQRHVRVLLAVSANSIAIAHWMAARALPKASMK